VAEFKFSNDASALLAASIDDNDTVVQVAAGFGALFPSPGVGEHFPVALRNANGDMEIVYCTSRTGDLLTVTRAQEGTLAQSWTLNATRVELRLTAGVMDSLLQKTGGVMSGDLDMNGHEVKDARMTGSTVMVGGQLVGTAIRGTEDDPSNEIAVPNDGSPATSGGFPIATTKNVAQSLPVGTILMWFGALGSIPTGFQLCDGTNGTPDLRGAFPRGAGGAIALGQTGGAASVNATASAGSGNVGATALSEDQMPAHNHRIWMGPVGAQLGGATVDVVYAFHKGGPQDYRNTIVDTTPPNKAVIEDSGGGATHTHSAGAHTHPVNGIQTIPPYVGIYFIMKVTA
jgi:microcystin-dependent protein